MGAVTLENLTPEPLLGAGSVLPPILTSSPFSGLCWTCLRPRGWNRSCGTPTRRGALVPWRWLDLFFSSSWRLNRAPSMSSSLCKLTTRGQRVLGLQALLQKVAMLCPDGPLSQSHPCQEVFPYLGRSADPPGFGRVVSGDDWGLALVIQEG